MHASIKKNKFSLKKIIIIISFIMVTIGLIFGSVVLKQEIDLRSRAAAAKIDLSLSSSLAEIAPDQEFDVDINMLVPEGVYVSAVQLLINYSTEHVEGISFDNASVFPMVISSGSIGRGKAEIALGMQLGQDQGVGSGTIAKLKFKVKSDATGLISINFSGNSDNIITVFPFDRGDGNSIGNMSGLNLTVISQTAPTETPIPAVPGQPSVVTSTPFIPRQPTTLPISAPTTSPTVIPTTTSSSTTTTDTSSNKGGGINLTSTSIPTSQPTTVVTKLPTTGIISLPLILFSAGIIQIFIGLML